MSERAAVLVALRLRRRTRWRPRNVDLIKRPAQRRRTVLLSDTIHSIRRLAKTGGTYATVTEPVARATVRANTVNPVNLGGPVNRV